MQDYLVLFIVSGRCLEEASRVLKVDTYGEEGEFLWMLCQQEEDTSQRQGERQNSRPEDQREWKLQGIQCLDVPSPAVSQHLEKGYTLSKTAYSKGHKMVESGSLCSISFVRFFVIIRPMLYITHDFLLQNLMRIFLCQLP